MKVLLDIPDSKAESLLAVLRSIPKVKVEPILSDKEKQRQHIKQSVKELNLILKGKLEAIPVEDILNKI